MRRIKVRSISQGHAQGVAVRSKKPVSFLGDVDSATGRITDPDNPLFGTSIAGKVLIFPEACGSTVGSYVLYDMAEQGTAPAALVASRAETIVAVGAIIAHIPLVDGLSLEDMESIHDGDFIMVDAVEGWVGVRYVHE